MKGSVSTSVSSSAPSATTIVTWQEAEDTLTAAFEYLSALPDRDRSFLAAGSRSCWPQIVRERWEYADVEAVPSARLTREHADLVDRMLIGERPLANVIPERHRVLVGRVIVAKRWPGPDGFGWDVIWRAMGGRLFNHVRGEVMAVTSDSMRKAYERGIGALAVAMDAHMVRS